MAEYHQGEVRALKDAVRRTDVTFFGPIFDGHYRRSENSGVGGLRGEKEALALTVEDPIIKRVGIKAVIGAAKDKGWSETYLSPRAKEVLDGFI